MTTYSEARTTSAGPGPGGNSPEEVASFFTGLDLVEPGITDARTWQPDWPDTRPFAPRAGHILTGAGKKP
jgi:S-adenosyl methyltransferase